MKCKYCGKSFKQKHHREVYCCQECRKFAEKERKARYAAKRRKLIRARILRPIDPEKYNMGSYGTSKRKHRKKSFKEEYTAIQREKKRIGLK